MKTFFLVIAAITAIVCSEISATAATGGFGGGKCCTCVGNPMCFFSAEKFRKDTTVDKKIHQLFTATYTTPGTLTITFENANVKPYIKELISKNQFTVRQMITMQDEFCKLLGIPLGSTIQVGMYPCRIVDKKYEITLSMIKK